MSLSRAPAGLQAAVRQTLGASPTTPTSAFQQGKLTSTDLAAGDEFGISVAMSGSTAVVGAFSRNSNAGAAYVFVRSGRVWSVQAELTASDAAAGDEFGDSVAIAGSTVVVGAENKNSNTGAAYVFVRSGSTWSQQAKLTASDAGLSDFFGVSVAVYSSTAVVGAWNHNSGAGSAYVFVRSGTTWSQQAELTASDAATGDQFGVAVAVYGSTAVVGALNENSGTGAAYVFVRSGSTWSQQAKLTASDGGAGDQLGTSVAVYGSTAVLGAPFGNSGTGAAYVFARSGTAWSQQAKLVAGDGTEDFFGESVAVYGSMVVVGAPFKNSQTGAAYVFVRSGAAWPMEAALIGSDSVSSDSFGRSVTTNGSTVIVGAPANSNTGAAYAFVLPTQQAELAASDAATGDSFGSAVAISGSTAVVGAWFKNSNTGAAYVFVRSGSRWSQQAKLTASDAAAGDEFGVSVGISGSTAIIGAWDKNSKTGAAYVFARSGTTWSQQAELTASDAAAGDQFGISVGISGSTAIVGAWFKNSENGAAYVFVQSGSTWSQQAELAPSVTGFALFGVSVAIYGSTAVIGAYGESGDRGAAYVFVRSGTAWSQQAKLTASDAAAGDAFGFSVAIYGSTVVVGAAAKNSYTGAAYVFASSGSTWSQQAELIASDSAAGAQFGVSVAIYGSTVVVGAYLASFVTDRSGAAYVFVRSGTAWPQAAELISSDAAVVGEFGDSVAINGSTAVIGAFNQAPTGSAYVFTNV